MSAKTKTVLKGFDYMHCDDFAKYLSDMAAKGWHFKEWGIGLKFEKGEPEDITYAVEVFTKASENDMRPEPYTQEFAEYCEAAGWKLVDGKQKFCIFKKVDENAVELFTPEERVTNAVKGTISGSGILLFILYGINALLQWTNLNISFESKIFSGTFFFTFSIWHIMFLGQLCVLVYAFWKGRKLKRDALAGKEIYIGNRRDGKYHFNLKEVYAALLVLFLMYYFFAMDRIELIVANVVIIGITLGFAFFINKIRPERDTNVMIQFGFSFMVFVALILFTVVTIADEGENVALEQEKLPVVITDYRECTDEISDIDYYHERNFLGSMDVYFVFGEKDSIYYHVYESEYSAVLDKIWKELVSGKKYNENAVDCTADWGANKAIRNQIGTYYVRYEDVILEFNDDADVYLTTDQIEIIRDKLDLR